MEKLVVYQEIGWAGICKFYLIIKKIFITTNIKAMEKATSGFDGRAKILKNYPFFVVL
jgi:hypothetical protein